MGTLRVLHRHLASPDEVVACLSNAADDPSFVQSRSRAWPHIQLVTATLSGSGAAVIPPLGFYAVARVTGGSPCICEHEGGITEEPTRMTPGATLVQGPGRAFRYVWSTRHQITIACLSSHVLARVSSESHVESFDPRESIGSFDERDAVCEHLLMVLAEEADAHVHAAQALIVESVANALACHLLGRLNHGAARQVSAAGSLGTRAFERVRAYVNENCGERISLNDLARVAGVSRFHFARQFRLRTGESPMGYLLRTRIERSKEMLRMADAKVADVAAALGFADQSHFTRTFRRLVGMPPSGFCGRRRRSDSASNEHGSGHHSDSPLARAV